jgi:hypothetical protein
MSLLLGKYFKGPTERKRYSIDYSDWLDAGELVQSVTFQVTPNDAGPVFIDGNSIQPGNKSVNFYANAGLNGVTYKVAVSMVTTANQDRVDTVQYTVRAV